MIYGDLKPQNVLIADEHPKITDFGLARITGETAMCQTGDFAGRTSDEPRAGAGEAHGHRPPHGRFSLGIVLYEMLALQRPFQSDTSHQDAA